jgi:hypothetical protein
MGDIQRVFEELNYPSARILKSALTSRGIPFDAKEVEALTKGEAVRQVQAPLPASKGKIVADKLNDLWFADLIDLTAAPSVAKKVDLKSQSAKYILVVQDVFSRKIWAEALKTKTPDEVLTAFKRILQDAGAKPNELTTDKGGEFGADFKRFLESEGIEVSVKTSMRQISTIDVAIGSLKKALVRDTRKAGTDDWEERLDKVVRGQNKIPKEDYLEGNAPASVEGDQALQRKLEDKNAEFQEINSEEIFKREANLRMAGFFRVMLDRPLNFARGFKPKWSTKVHTVDTVDFDTVIDTEGQKFKTKFVLPVSQAGPESRPVRMEGRGSAQTEEKKRRILEELADTVKSWLGMRTLSIAEVGKFLKQHDFRNKAREARINMKSPVLNFLRTFPETFEVGRSQAGYLVNRKRGEPAFPGAQRLRRPAA